MQPLDIDHDLAVRAMERRDGPLEADEPEGPPPTLDDAPQASPPLPALASMPLSQHFALAEFRSHDGAAFPSSVVANLGKLAQVLEKIRAHFGGRPVRILSGYRSPAHNAAVGGAKTSQHMFGTACDIVIDGVPPGHVAEFAATLPEVGGVGRYPKQQFTHVDIRPRIRGACTRWDG